MVRVGGSRLSGRVSAASRSIVVGLSPSAQHSVHFADLLGDLRREIRRIARFLEVDPPAKCMANGHAQQQLRGNEGTRPGPGAKLFIQNQA
jgi:hypothetical protein